MKNKASRIKLMQPKKKESNHKLNPLA